MKTKMISPQFKTHTIMTPEKHQIAFDHYQCGSNKLILIAPGFANCKDSVLLKDLAKELNSEYDVMIMDFRGHGKSGGLFSWTSKEYLDLQAILEFAKRDYKEIGVIGFSLGAATAMIAASKFEGISTVISVAGPSEMKKIEYRFWELDFETDIVFNMMGGGRKGKLVRPGAFWLQKDKPIEIVQQLKCPIFYIHGESDWLIKPWHSKALYEKTPTKKRLAVIKNGPHAEYLIRNNREETLGLIRDWLNEIF